MRPRSDDYCTAARSAAGGCAVRSSTSVGDDGGMTRQRRRRGRGRVMRATAETTKSTALLPAGALISALAVSLLIQPAHGQGVLLDCPIPTASTTTTSTSSSEIPYSVSTPVPPNVNHFGVSTRGRLCTLTKLLPATSTDLKKRRDFVPLARSYDGRPWEVSAGPYASTLKVDACYNVDDDAAADNEANAGAGAGAANDTSSSSTEHQYWGGGAQVVPRGYCVLSGLPTLYPGEGELVVTGFRPRVNMTREDVAARFLERASFGATRSSIEEFLMLDGDFYSTEASDAGGVTGEKAETADSEGEEGASVVSDLASLQAKWISGQMHPSLTPPTLHRAYWRSRLNPRWPNAETSGLSSHPCDIMGRWRTYAFTALDAKRGKFGNGGVVSVEPLVAEGLTYSSLVLKVDGEVRTIVPKLEFDDDTQGKAGDAYAICNSLHSVRDEYLGGPFKLRLLPNGAGADGGPCKAVKGGNPAVNFKAQPNLPSSVIRIPPGSLRMVDGTVHRYGTFLVQHLPSPKYLWEEQPGVCKSIPHSSGDDDTGDVPTVIGKLPGGNTWLVFDPRLVLHDNSLQLDATWDGGAETHDLSGGTVPCSNVPRTFVNEDHCVLRFVEEGESNTCGAASSSAADASDADEDDGEASRVVDEGLLQELHSATGRFLYAIDFGSRSSSFGDEVPSPCRPGSRSRWLLVDDPAECSGAQDNLRPETRTALADLIQSSSDTDDALLRDAYLGRGSNAPKCHSADADASSMHVTVLSGDNEDTPLCFRNVHPDHGTVYDFTEWGSEADDPEIVASPMNMMMKIHPGNAAAAAENRPNPIASVAKGGSATLQFPEWHPLDRWDAHKDDFAKLSRLGDTLQFNDLPESMQTEKVSRSFRPSSTATTSAVSGGTATSSRQGSTVLVCGSPGESSNDPTLGASGTSLDSHDGDVFRFSSSTNPKDEFPRQKEVVWTNVVLNSDDQLRQRVAWALSQIFAISPGSLNVLDFDTEAFLVYYDIFVRNAFGNYRDVLKEVSYSGLMAVMLSYLRSKSSAFVRQNEGDIVFPDENFAREVMQLFTIGLFELNLDGTPKLDPATGRTIPTYDSDHIETFARAWTGFTLRDFRGNVENGLGGYIDPMRIVPNWRDRFPKMGLDHGKYVGDAYPLCRDLPSDMFLRKGARYRILDESALSDLLRGGGGASPLLLNPATSDLYEALCNADGGNCIFANQVVLPRTLSCSGSTECKADDVRVVQMSAKVFYEYVEPPCVRMAFLNGARRKGNVCVDPATEAASNDPCEIKAKVNEDGKVAIVHDYGGGDGSVNRLVRSDSLNYFRVDWSTGDYPVVSNGCGYGACEVEDDHCMCRTAVSEESPFGAAPTKSDIMSRLHVGTVDPSQDSSLAAFDVSDDVVAYHGSPNEDGSVPFDANTIFQVRHDVSGKMMNFKNVESKVKIFSAAGDETTYEFRNAPHFMSLSQANVRDAQDETEAVLDNYFHHPNVAPFVSIRLIQRFGVSNPSPRYVESVATAFRDGLYVWSDEHGSEDDIMFGKGEYGDLAATMAALLLDSEARSVVLDADPAHGSIREPLLKVIGFMRAMEYVPNGDRPLAQLMGSDVAIGQMAHSIPSVFSFFLPEYSPRGPLTTATLVAPEAQILTTPKVVGVSNALLSLIKYGLSTCDFGLGPELKGSSCSGVDGDYSDAVGRLMFSPSSQDVDEVVDELATLLTGGRLSQDNRALIKETYYQTLGDRRLQAGAANAFRSALQVISTTAEFHATNLVENNGQEREPIPLPSPSDREYKAVVYLFLDGGLDSYNMLVPHSGCAQKDLFAEYKQVRGKMALEKGVLHPVSSAFRGSSQPCTTFGLHPKLSFLQELYNENSALFLANLGVLVNEFINKGNYKDEAASRLFAHNTQIEEVQRVDPYDATVGTGLLGRMTDTLTRNGFQTGSYSVDQMSVSLVGEPGESPPTHVLGEDGAPVFDPNPSSDEIRSMVEGLNGATSTSSGLFGETWSSFLHESINQAEVIHEVLEEVSTTTSFPRTSLGKQFEMVSRLIKAHGELGTDRDVFFVRMSGFDNHENMMTKLDKRLEVVSDALRAFVSEMKEQGMWENVVLAETSDFARTLTPNSSKGTDHAWGGNYFALGGGVKGGQILGQYPSDLTAKGDLNVGRGRIIPTTSWEMFWNGIAQWFGITEEDDLNGVIPNRKKFSNLFQEDDIFGEWEDPLLEGACASPYVEGETYKENELASNQGKNYACRAAPYNGLCSGAAQTYSPGSGTNWQDAWVLVGDCEGDDEPQLLVTPMDDDGACAPAYVEGYEYAEYDRVSSEGVNYECKPFPFTGWCSRAAFAYGPGFGQHWQDAWDVVGSCQGETAPIAVFAAAPATRPANAPNDGPDVNEDPSNPPPSGWDDWYMGDARSGAVVRAAGRTTEVIMALVSFVMLVMV